MHKNKIVKQKNKFPQKYSARVRAGPARQLGWKEFFGGVKDGLSSGGKIGLGWRLKFEMGVGKIFGFCINGFFGAGVIFDFSVRYTYVCGVARAKFNKVYFLDAGM